MLDWLKRWRAYHRLRSFEYDGEDARAISRSASSDELMSLYDNLGSLNADELSLKYVPGKREERDMHMRHLQNARFGFG